MLRFSQVKQLQKHKGQATSELLVSMAVLAPLFILIPVVANYLDIQTATHEASRYVAWERTAHTTIDPSSIADQVQSRFVENESAGFSSSAGGVVDSRWQDYGRDYSATNSSSLVNVDDVAAVSMQTLPTNITSPVDSSNIGAIQGMSANALAATSVSVPLDEDGSLFAVFGRGASFLESSPDRMSAPYDNIAQKHRFNTNSTAVLLVANNIIPQNDAAYTATTNTFVTTDGSRLGGWQAPLKMLNVVTLGFFDELDILESGGDLEAVSTEQSTILPEGLVEYRE